MAILVLRTYNVTLFRADGEEVDQTQIDEKSEEVAADLFYGESDFGHEKLPGDYFEFYEDTETMDEEEYESIYGDNREAREILRTVEA